MRIRTRLAALAIALAVGGCASPHGIRPDRDLTAADFSRLSPGMTAAEVIAAVGRPITAMPLPRLREEVWDYRYFDALTPIKVLLYFDPNGVLKRAAQGYDHEYYHGGMDAR